MAYEFYITVEGTKTGKFKGESERSEHKSKLPALSFESSVASPRDASTGRSSGKRVHEPIVFRKEVGASTPQFANSLVKNEVLKSVLFEFVHTNKDGKEEIVFTIKLSDATVTSQKLILPDVADVNGGRGKNLTEEIQLSFKKIEWEHKVGKTMTIDDWYAANS
jgi:type VI secretion system secreted protein Hcp